jgi:hypothetical protein
LTAVQCRSERQGRCKGLPEGLYGGLVHLKGAKYQKVAGSDDPITQALIENYRIRLTSGNKGVPPKKEIKASSTLFDPAAVYLSFSTDLMNTERLPIIVSDDGFTRIGRQGKPIDCAMS